MKLFKKSNKPYYEFNYKVGEVIDVEIDGKWQVHQVLQHPDGEVYLQPYTSGLDLSWLYKLNEYKVRQTPDTFKRAKKVLENEKQAKLDVINHTMDKNDIAEIEVMLKDLKRQEQS